MRCRLLPQRLKGAPGSLIQETSLFKTAVLFEQGQQAIQRILVGGETHQVLFQHFFRQADLPMLEIEIGQVAHHTAARQPQPLLPFFDEPMTCPLGTLIVGEKLTAQEGVGFFPQGQCGIRRNGTARL
jgi:hypothetical protein